MANEAADTPLLGSTAASAETSDDQGTFAPEELPILCGECLGPNSLIGVTKLPFGSKICQLTEQPFQPFQWKIDNDTTKETVISTQAAKERNICQACLNSLADSAVQDALESQEQQQEALESSEPAEEVKEAEAKIDVEVSEPLVADAAEQKCDHDGQLAQRQVLVDLFQSTRGEQWVNHTNWCSDAPIESWFGIKCNDQGQVVQIQLRSNNLNGPLPESIGRLTSLVNLCLEGNNITGKIPASIGQLVRLEHIWLHKNQLTGPIPTTIGHLSELMTLSLSYNELDGPIPEQISELECLQMLSLNENFLTGAIPDGLWNLQRLSVATLNRNELSGRLSESIANARSLTRLILDENRLTGSIPASISNLPYLQALSLNFNQLTGTLPGSMQQMTQLRHLELVDNNIKVPAPSIRFALRDNQARLEAMFPNCRNLAI